MFENTLQVLNQLSNGMTYKMDILPDEDGYFDKECPNESCMCKFKVSAEDWRNLFSDDAVYCPFCGHTAPARSWWTTEQVEQARQQAKMQLATSINQAMSEDVRRFNGSQPRNSFIKNPYLHSVANPWYNQAS